MKCDKAGEFISRLCDGQVIPRQAAEHIGVCQHCHARLSEYLEMGAELRRLASLEQPTTMKVGSWEMQQRLGFAWWRRGAATMRIPRFAFASMLVVILLLSGGLVLVRARGNNGGSPVFALGFRVPPQTYQRTCFMLPEPNKTCTYSTTLNNGESELGLMVRFISRDNNRTELGVKAAYESDSTEFNFKEDVEAGPEKIISVQSGQEDQVEVPGLGEIQITGQYLDHQPIIWGSVPNEPLPPKNEFAIVDPVLIRGSQVICDLSGNGYSIDDGDLDATLMIYYPGEGRYLISTVPFEGAVEGAAKMAQIRFSLDGQDYLLMSGIPILRSNRVWVSHDPGYKISEHIQGQPDDQPFFHVRSLKLWERSQIQQADLR
jgi:hypothetical protein